MSSGDHSSGFAIVGMAGRFPKAPDVESLWRLIAAGGSGITRFSADELEDTFDDETRADPSYVPARPILDDLDRFDAGFFGMLPREAALTDPQQRILLECAWHALEDAGCDPQRHPGTIGVFAGSSINSYFLRHVCPDREALQRFTSDFQVGSYQELLGTLHDFVATRIAYKLDLKGPAVAVQSACSTSLLAVAQACQSLAFYQCDMALAGGVSATLPQKRGYIHQDGGMVSPVGTCRPFDAEAAGTVFGSGAGLVALKRLADALADGDRIYAVIKGYGVNNDGATKVGFTAPSVEGQAACIGAALGMAGVSPETIGYVECHGTATPLGDPIEIAGLVKAHADMAGSGLDGVVSRATPCVLGSIKANVGHLDAAAGVTGLIKTALILHHKKLPPQANFERENPRLDLAAHGLRVNRASESWPDGETPRRAGVSAFGVGGTNVHLVLEEAPLEAAPADAEVEGEGAVVLALSAKSAPALDAMRARLADALAASPPPHLPDLARTLRDGRAPLPHRLAVAASDTATAERRLRAAKLPKAPVVQVPKIVFAFPGQGSQYPGMAQALYARDPGVRADIDRGAVLLEPLLGLDIRGPLLDQEPGDDDKPHPIRSTVLAQPALFLVEYALARLLQRLGVQPDAMIGHSLGEFTAACLAGVMSFEDMLRLIARRGQLMQALPGGAMLSVRCSKDTLRPLLPDGVDIAAANAPALTVASGPFEAVERLEQVLEQRGIAHRRLHTSHAFHSAMVSPVVAELQREVAGLPLSPPQIPFMSSMTGDWISAAEATSHDYWAWHCRATVEFGRAASTLVEALDPAAGIVVVEVGPGSALSTFVDAAASQGGVRTVRSLPDFQDRHETEEILAEALGALWAAGVPADLRGIGPRGAGRANVPLYAFERHRHWIDAPAAAAEPLARALERLSPEPAAASTPTSNPPLQAIAGPGTPMKTDDVQSRVASLVAGQLEELQGRPVPADAFEASFLNLGCDSLLLGQLAQKLSRTFGIKLTFRQLMRDLPSVAEVAAHIVTNAPAEKLPKPAEAAPVVAMSVETVPVGIAVQMLPVSAAAGPAVEAAAAQAGGTALQALLRDQLTTMQSIFAAQLTALGTPAASAVPASVPALAPVAPPTPTNTNEAAPVMPTAADEPPSRFQMYRGGGAATAELDAQQRVFLDDLIRRYNAKTPGSKARTQAARDVLADPRSASGFRAIWKEMVYPIVCASSKGARITDIDGNTYIDLVNGYGQTMFGHAPDFVVDAVEKQLRAGFAIGPQSPLAGEVAAKISRMTGNERVAFCNTGSEAVMAAMRVARTVTGRDKVVVFGGGYHGQFDEVLVKGRGRGGTPGALPIAPGIPVDNVASMIVLPNGSAEALQYVRTIADDLAAVIVEPVQSRHPDLVPVEFLRELRAVTEKSGAALVFDEVVTGFRVGPGGMQAVLGIRADLATYGKVLGGGMPIGVLAGRRDLMDALDGGTWRYGDDSVPEVAPTFFAGTFVRHPLVLAAANAVLDHIAAAGPALYESVGAHAASLAASVNGSLSRAGLGLKAEHYASWLYLDVSREGPLASLFYPHLRLLGINAQEGFPLFLTTEHGAAEVEAVTQTVEETVQALSRAGLFTSQAASPAPAIASPAAARSEAELPRAVPLTEPQREILLAAQLGDAASMVFNESVSVAFDGPLDTSALADAVRDVIQRHEALRGHVDFEAEALVVAERFDLDVPVFELDEARLAELVALDARTPFELSSGPLVRAVIVRLDEARHVLVFTAHHIVCDGWSMNVVLSELAELYRARIDGGAPALDEIASFRRYALDQQTLDRSGNAAFWRREFESIPDPLDLPGDRPRPETKTFAGASLRETIDGDLAGRLAELAKSQGVTLFSLLFAGVQTTFSRLGGRSDTVLTVPMAGQALVEDQALVGHCVNFLPIRAPIEAGASFAQHLNAVHKRLGVAFDHQDYTLGTLVRDLDIARNPSRTPLSDIQFNLEKIGGKLDFGALRSTVTTNPKAFVNFDLFINMIQREGDILVEVDYATDLFDEATVSRWLGHLRVLLDHAARDPKVDVARLPLLSGAEIRWLRDELNASDVALPQTALVHRLFEEQVDRTPDALAARCGEAALTYRELDERGNRIARQIQALVPGAGERIAIALPRSLDMLATLIAVLKSGHAYVPLDPGHPEERLRQTMMLADCAAIVTAGNAVSSAVPDGARIIDLDAEASVIAARLSGSLGDPARTAGDDPTAYVIFTSGSTGAPKGVEIGHRAVCNLLLSMASEPGFDASDRLVAVTTISFDIAGLELLLPLVCGGATVIADKAEVSDILALRRLMTSDGAIVLQATPTLWRELLHAGVTLRPGTRILCGGEPLSSDLASDLLATGGELWNVYGPTETTIWSSRARITDADAPITIGGPIANTQLHVIDQNGELCPIGVPGELVIGGVGLAKGYFRRPDLTAAAFVDIAPAGGAPTRMYRTGDMAMRRADGSLVHLGRRDHQVKVRGFRIELEEIEAVLRAEPGVADAAVGVAGAGTADATLVASLVAEAGQELVIDAVKQSLAAHLPGYMVPSRWRTLPALPRTGNGKLDRSALARLPFPVETPRAVAPPAPASTPADPVLVTISEVVGAVLGRTDLAPADRLFALGANSLHIFRIAARLNERGIRLGAEHLLTNPSLAHLAELASSAQGQARPIRTGPSLADFARSQRRVRG